LVTDITAGANEIKTEINVIKESSDNLKTIVSKFRV
jgi:hypothetical protein